GLSGSTSPVSARAAIAAAARATTLSAGAAVLPCGLLAGRAGVSEVDARRAVERRRPRAGHRLEAGTGARGRGRGRRDGRRAGLLGFRVQRAEDPQWVALLERYAGLTVVRPARELQCPRM